MMVGGILFDSFHLPVVDKGSFRRDTQEDLACRLKGSKLDQNFTRNIYILAIRYPFYFSFKDFPSLLLRRTSILSGIDC